MTGSPTKVPAEARATSPADRRAFREWQVPIIWSDAGARKHLPSQVRATLVGPEGAPLLIVLGGISANADVIIDAEGLPGWWQNLFPHESALSRRNYRILGLDYAADWRGGFAPSPYDQAELIQAAMGQLGEPEPYAIIGASYGGMVALAYAQQYAPKSTRLVVISADSKPHPSATAIRSIQRRVVQLGLEHECEIEALGIARGLAMLSYRSPAEFEQRFEGGISDSDPLGPSQPGNYLSALGIAFAGKMSPGRFLSLSASIDRQRVDVSALRNPVLFIAIEEDQLVPFQHMRAMARSWGGTSEFHAVRSIFGHDAFLKEAGKLSGRIAQFLESDVL